MKAREMSASEREIVYIMGYKEWGKGTSKEDYWDICLYEETGLSGIRFVLKSQTGEIASSLIVFPHKRMNQWNAYVIESLVTPREQRGKGYGKELVRRVIKLLEKNGSEPIVFLYSDISPTYYESLSFRMLPKKFQKHNSTYLMVFANNPQLEVLKTFPKSFFPAYK